ncbi:MAG: cellulase family glycosylhydrolase [Armatimonadota bacterium]
MLHSWLLLSGLVVCSVSVPAVAQAGRSPAGRLVRVDPEGVLRWQDDGSEVALFGVNYYAPCSIDYASLKQLGADHELTIRQDVAHFERMGLDAIRLHVFDREISDERGNLLDNDHLRLLDYLVNECKRRGIYTVLTPMAWWGSPENTHGFSDLYTKAEMYTDPAAIEAQRNYLRQFVSHRNRYTGLTYAEDPAVIVFEIINEPIPASDTSDDTVIAYINTLCQAMRSAGCTKPIFYNGWGGRLGAVGRSEADGCTFGWYPTGLVAGRMLTANFLPRVDDYPSMRSPGLKGKPKIVYEFDAADVPGSYMYPAMARAFRSGGAQIATQFQYDPLPVATSNADWQTHFLNLIYTPKKAVSFIIAAEAFRALPRLRTYGTHPDSDRFGDFRVSYEEQLSEMVTREAFMYSNDTRTKPPAPGQLRRIVGCGSSPVVEYEGTGAYFLERVAPGMWRLEVYPDAVWVADPYGPASLGREVARVYWRERAMTVSLPDLGRGFTGERISEGEPADLKAERGKVTVEPGAYILYRADTDDVMDVQFARREFIAPKARDLPPAVWHVATEEALAGEPLPIEATVASAVQPSSVTVQLRSADGGPVRAVELRQSGPYRYAGRIPGRVVERGAFTYCIAVRIGGEELVFPSPGTGGVEDRLASREPTTLLDFSPEDQAPEVQFGGAPGRTAASGMVAGSREGRGALRVTATGFGPPPSAAGVRLPVKASGEALSRYNTLIVRARRSEKNTSHLEVGLVEADGSAWGCHVPLGPAFGSFRVPLARLRPLWGTVGVGCQPEQVTHVSLVFGSWLFPGAAEEPHGVEIEGVSLAYEPEAWRVAVHGREDPIVIFAAREPLPKVNSPVPYSQSLVAGWEPDALAWRLAVDGFGPAPNCASVRTDLSAVVAARRPAARSHDSLLVRARAGEATTDAVEIVLSESDGTPWGATPALTTEWQDIRIPLSELGHFAHWQGTPEGRGGEGDYCHVEDLATLTVTFGAWLYPDTADEPHSLEIEYIRLEKRGG